MTIVFMADGLGSDAHYVVATARLFDWRVFWRSGGRLRLARDEWQIRALFGPAGAFRHAKVRFGAQSWRGLGLPELVGLLEGKSSALPSSA
jgi:hypothetical protein